MPWSDHHRRCARHNQQHNVVLLDSCSMLADELLTTPVHDGAPSLLNCWNQLILTDALWLQRLTRTYPILEEIGTLTTAQGQAFNSSQPHNLLAPLFTYTDLTTARTARLQLDDLLLRWCDLLRQDDAKAVVVYNEGDNECSVGLNKVLHYLFDHHSFRRGQISLLLMQLGVDDVDIDAADLLSGVD
ncbi:hypothetical protein CHH28_10205 [Bacterioplanes sanyensis]|uniref:Uncharacterized protein n=1 Tax=Bacterioplanes sanyensis TaxID=1249553 RepID=A0A222FKB4_9GAMM|nr:DinB family protein [Bacterioplanes sanyensis]ASP39026.1 hypothetical protein CHH28_10205 [Bacterioplanes sanyensis]